MARRCMNGITGAARPLTFTILKESGKRVRSATLRSAGTMRELGLCPWLLCPHGSYSSFLLCWVWALQPELSREAWASLLPVSTFALKWEDGVCSPPFFLWLFIVPL